MRRRRITSLDAAIAVLQAELDGRGLGGDPEPLPFPIRGTHVAFVLASAALWALQSGWPL